MTERKQCSYRAGYSQKSVGGRVHHGVNHYVSCRQYMFKADIYFMHMPGRKQVDVASNFYFDNRLQMFFEKW